MTPIISRLFIWFDEWPYILLCLFLFMHWVAARIELLQARAGATSVFSKSTVHEFKERAWRYAFIIVLISGFIFVYCISYPMYYNLSNEHPSWWP